MVDANALNRSARPTAPQIRNRCIDSSLGVMIDTRKTRADVVTPEIAPGSVDAQLSTGFESPIAPAHAAVAGRGSEEE